MQRVRLLLEARRWEDAVTALGPVLAASPGEAEPYCLLAQAYLGGRRPEDAVGASGRALAVEPGSTWAHRLHVLALHNAGRDAEAVRSARWLTSVEPDEWRSWWVLSVVARGLGHGSQLEALEAAGRAVQLAPEHADTHDALGAAQLAAGRLDDAEASFRRALALSPSDSFAHNGLGQLGLHRRDPASAAGGFREALAADPREQAARHNLEVALQHAARPFTVAIWAATFALRIFVIDAHPRTWVVRAGALAAGLVCTGFLTYAWQTFVARLTPDLRTFYARFVRRDRRLAAGAALNVLAILLLFSVVAFPAHGPATGLSAGALAASLAGRLLFFRGRRWSLFGFR